jgi:hypothetical protein
MATETALVPDEVIIGTSNGPGIWVAPVGTAAPLTASAVPAAPWSTLGYLSEDGVTFSQSTDSEAITPWQSRAAVRTIITKRELNLEFTMLQFNEQNVALYFSSEEPASGDSWDLEVRSDAPAKNYAILVDVKDGDNTVRYHFPRATLSEAGDMEVTKSGAIGLPVTMAAQDDNGVLANIQFAGKTTAPAAAKATTTATTA